MNSISFSALANRANANSQKWALASVLQLKNLSVLLFSAGSFLLSGDARAEVKFYSNHASQLCLGRTPSGTVALEPCIADGTNLRFTGYGLVGVRVGNEYRCLQSNGKERQLTWGTCIPGKNYSRWKIVTDEPNFRANLRNEEGLCADIIREGNTRNTGIQAFTCGAVPHRQWTLEGRVSSSEPPQGPIVFPGDSLPANLKPYLPAIQKIVGAGKLVDIAEIQSNLVAAGGGNLVAAGGGNLTFDQVQALTAAAAGNLVAAGGGNMVAAGGGNLGPQASTLVAAGGGNVMVKFGAGLVAAGGGNLVAAGGGNLKILVDAARLIGNDGSTFSSAGLVNLVQSGGASVTSLQISQLLNSASMTAASNIASVLAASNAVPTNAGNFSAATLNTLALADAGRIAQQNPAFIQQAAAVVGSRSLFSVPDSGWCRDAGFVAVFKTLVGREPNSVKECDPNTYRGGAWSKDPVLSGALTAAVRDPAKMQTLANMVLGKWEGFRSGQPTPPPSSPTPPPATSPTPTPTPAPLPPTVAPQAGNFNIVAASGKCLAPASGGGVLVWDCVNNPNQVFERTSIGQIKQGGQCLGNSGNQIRLEPCGGSSATHQLWLQAGSSLRNSNVPPYCMDVAGGGTANGTGVNAMACSGSSAQSWSLRSVGAVAPPPPPPVQPAPQPQPQPQPQQPGNFNIVAASGKCLAPAAGGGLLVWDCVNNPNQVFERTSIGQIKQGGQCLGNSGNQVRLEACGGSSATHQLWLQAGSTLRNSNVPPYCLDVAGGGTANGTGVNAVACSGSSAQSWNLRSAAAVTPPPPPQQPSPPPPPPAPPVASTVNVNIVSSYAGKCLSPGAGGGVLIWDCVNNPNQLFERTAIGQLKQNGLCLGNSGNALGYQPCGGAGATHQLWTDTGGVLKNKNVPPSCMDIENGGQGNGTRVLAFNCQGSPNQQWRLINK